MKKIITVLCLSFVTLVGLVGCKGNGEPVYDKNQKVNAGEIAWDVSMGVEYGNRRLMCKFTNNSKYTITDLEITLRPKKSASNKEIDELIDYICSEYDITGEDKEYLLEYGDLRMEANVYGWDEEDYLKPGESATDAMSYYGVYYVMNMDYYDLFAPDIMTIEFLDENGNECVTYYDYINKTYTNE